MASVSQTGRRSRWQRVYRFCRCAALGLVLALVAAYIYLDQAGVPDFLKARLQQELRARGVDVEFSRLRFRWYRGLVAETVRFRRGDAVDGPELLLQEMVLRLNTGALRQRKVQLDAIELINGQFVLPVAATNDPLPRLTWDRIQAEIQFLPGDRWSLNRLTAEFQGARLHLSGILTNASAVQSQRPFGDPTTASAPWRSSLRQFVQELRRMRFAEPPEVHLDVRGDARRPLEITAAVRFQAREAKTLWGTSQRLVAVARLNQATGTPGLGRSELELEARDTHTPWSDTALVRLALTWSQSPTNPVPVTVNGQFDLEGLYTAWGETPQLRFSVTGHPALYNPALLETEWRLTSGALLTVGGSTAATNELTAHLIHDDTHPLPRTGDWKLHVQEPCTPWGGARDVRISGHFERKPADTPLQATPEWGLWSTLEPVRFSWETDIDELQLTNIVFEKVHCAGAWDAPKVTIERLRGQIDGRSVELRGQIDVASRRLEADCQLALDVKRVGSLLTARTRKWLEDYEWVTPPAVQSRLWLTLPAWTNAQPDWRAEVQPTLGLSGTLEGTNGPYRFKGVPMDTARFRFDHTNRVWLLTDFVATAPEGRLAFTYREDQSTRDYRFDLAAQLDPRAFKPLVPTNYQRGFDLFAFREPPAIAGTIQGRWHAPERTAFSGTVDARDFTFRGDAIRQLQTRLSYTNRWLTARNVRLDAGLGEITAAGVDLNTADSWLTLTDARSTVLPTRVSHAIGPKVEEVLCPYVFHRPPTARVDGRLNVRRTREADLRIALEGGPFSWWRFQVPHVKGLVHWQGESLTITNVEAQFYQGNLNGRFAFDFAAGRGAGFRFYTHLFNVNLHQMMADLWSPTNSLEGTLIGDLEVTRASTDDWKSWQGFGRAELLDGYLWDIPLAGVFSEALNNVLPGIAKSRVGGLTSTFTITNSLIHTADLALRSPVMRLAYRGTFDFDGNVNGRVEAQLLRDLSGIGSIVRVVLFPVTKLFEYKVTGTVSHPEQEPLYIPKALLFPLNPVGAVRDLLTPDKKPPDPPVPKE